MNKVILVIGIIAVIVIFLIIVAYFFIEKPIQSESEIQYSNLNLKVLNHGNQVAEQYYISSFSNLISNGSTLSKDYLQAKVLINNSYTVFIDGKDIYSNYTTFFLESWNKELIMNVDKINKINMKLSGEMGANNLILNLTSDSSIKNRLLCFRWGSSIISVSINNFTRTDVPERLKIDKCYDINIDKTSLEIPINYIDYVGTDKFIRFYLVFYDYDYKLNKIYEDGGKYYKIDDIMIEVTQSF